MQRKEQEYASLQEEVSKLNSKLDKVRQEHAAEMGEVMVCVVIYRDG